MIRMLSSLLYQPTAYKLSEGGLASVRRMTGTTSILYACTVFSAVSIFSALLFTTFMYNDLYEFHDEVESELHGFKVSDHSRSFKYCFLFSGHLQRRLVRDDHL